MFWLERATGVLTPVSFPSGVSGFKNSNNLLYLFGSSIFVYNVTNGIYIDTIAYAASTLGQTAVDFITNKLVYVAGPNLFSYNPITETQISVVKPFGSTPVDFLFIGADSLYIGSTLYSAQSLTQLSPNTLPFNLYAPNTFNSSNYVYDYNKRHFIYKVTTLTPFNQSPPRHILKKCDRFGSGIQNISDEYVQTIGGPSYPGTGPGFEVKSTINGDAIIYWDGGEFVFNNYWITKSTQIWLKMRDDGFVEQVTPGHVSGFEFSQYPKNTVVNLLFNKNCVDNQMVPRGIYLFNR
jgi:hypothetical protein